MFLTLGAIKSSTVANIPGVNPQGAAFVQYVNEITRNLMKRGDWASLLWPIQVCVRKGSIAWPRYVGQVRYVNICHHPLPIHAINYRFLDRGQGHRKHLCGGECSLEQAGRVPIYNDMPIPGWTLRAYPMLKQDAGKTMTIYGVDQYQQPLRHQNPDLSWSDGRILTLAYPYGSLLDANTTLQSVYRIDRVVRESTQGNVILYALYSDGVTLQDLATYEPSETNPDYARSMLHLPCTIDCSKVVSVIAMVKLRHIDAVADSDLVLIDDLEALKNFFQSSRFGEAGDIENKRAYELEAIRALNLKQKDDMPDEQMPIDVLPFGATHIGRQMTF